MISHTRFNGFDAVQLSDDRLRLTVLPAWGGKIAEWFDRKREREWLFTNPALPYRPPIYDSNYVREFDVGGFDECFPTVGACPHPSEPWRGTPLPDHGEVWSIPWEARIEGDRLRLSVHGVRLGYRFEKSVRLLGGGRVRLEYRAENLTPFPMPFLWSSHPLFALRSGMQIRIPTDRMRVYSSPAFPAHHGDALGWPMHGDRDLGTVPEPGAAIALKLFSPPLSEGWASLSDPSDGASFRFEFDPARITHVGLWINYGGWAGAPGADPYFNIAFEPCIGAPDTLDTAVNHWGEHGTLPPHGAQEWWLDAIVG